MKIRFALALVAGLAGSAVAQDIPALRFIGQQQIATGTAFSDGTIIGGLSGIDFDPSSGTYYAIADDRSQINPARFYNLSLAFDQNSFSGVTFNSRTTLLNTDGSAYGNGRIDPEAIRLDRATGRFFYVSEGERSGTNLQSPFVREMNADGSFVRDLNVDGSRYNPTSSGLTGLRQNLAFESLSLSTDGNTVYTATENALFQDGTAATVNSGTRCRVASFNKATGNAGAEYVYLTEPVAAQTIPAGAFATNGLVEILAISDTTFLTVERSFSTGVGNSIKIFKASIAGASDVSGVAALTGSETAMTKELLFDLDTLGIYLDNIEGITLGPVLPNGSRSVVVVSDNNFSSTQVTQFIAFEVVPAPGTMGLLAVAGLVAGRRRR